MSEPDGADDVALVLGASEDAEKLAVLRKRGESVEAAVLQKAHDGQPVHGDLVRLTSREEPLLYDVETLHEAPRGAGPAKVASRAYREGWDRIFAKLPAKRRKPARALN